MTSRLAWEDLVRLYPAEFETARPRLLARDDPAYAQTILSLDSVMKLVQRHRVETVIERLQPTVKWPSDRAPDIDWTDLDALLKPWLNGDAFDDRVPISNWPMPAVDQLDRYDRKSQLQYWTAAAKHFEEMNWLDRTPVTLQSQLSGRVGAAESVQLSADAAQILAAHPKVSQILPLGEDQIQFATGGRTGLIDPATIDRLRAVADGIIFNTPTQRWPGDMKHPQRWLRTDTPGLVQYFGAGGDERDVCVWSWLAFLRQADLVQWPVALPRTSGPSELADPNDLVWFYPGQWFGVPEPLATIQLKWLRRAQQDYEYLWLAHSVASS